MSTKVIPRHFDYALVDVFAERPLEGNMLAIFTDARGLADQEMQALARETNLAETTFILPGEPAAEAADGVRVRIFTTREELPFAGHPTLGTASWLHRNHPNLRHAETITLRLNSGPVTVRFRTEEPDASSAYGTMQQRDPVFGRMHEPEDVARVTGLALADLDPTLPPQTVSTGLPFCIVPVQTSEALGRLQVPQDRASAYLAAAGARFFYVIAPSGASDAHFEARMQFYNGEDPATGSAAGCAISYLVRHGRVPSEAPTILAQGTRIGRPSRIYTSAALTENTITRVFVGGRTFPVATGRFSLPLN